MCQLSPVACAPPSASCSVCALQVAVPAFYLATVVRSFPLQSHVLNHNKFARLWAHRVTVFSLWCSVRLSLENPNQSVSGKWIGKQSWKVGVAFASVLNFLISPKALVPPCCGAKTWNLSWRVGLEPQVQLWLYPWMDGFPWKSIQPATLQTAEKKTQCHWWLLPIAASEVSDKPGEPTEPCTALSTRI